MLQFPVHDGGLDQSQQAPYNGGYPPQSQYPNYAYDQQYNGGAPQQEQYHYDGYNAQAYDNSKDLPPPPGMQSPEQQGWVPGTPDTFGAAPYGAEHNVHDPYGTGAGLAGAGTAMAFGAAAASQPQPASPGAYQQQPMTSHGLTEGSHVTVRQGFVRSLDDELVVQPGDNLVLVQAYDDGWSLCERVLDNGTVDRGVVPISCLEGANAVSMPAMPEPAMMSGGQEFLANEPGRMTRSVYPVCTFDTTACRTHLNTNVLHRSSTARSLAISERSERRSSLYFHAQAAGQWLEAQNQPLPSPAR